MRDIMAAIDLHSNNLVLALMDKDGKRLLHKKLPCEVELIHKTLLPFKDRIDTIAVESTFNWYWLVDGLEDAGHRVVLANPAAIAQYSGIKHTDDKDDAFWLAEMSRLGILPTGHICERRLRSVRDLLRRRLLMVQNRTSFILSLRSLHMRAHGSPLSLKAIKAMEVDDVWRLFKNAPDQLASREELRLIQELDTSIERLEKQVLAAAIQMPEFHRLKEIPGIGKILGMTIALEAGEMKRFPTPGDFASYCRCVPSARTSNGRKKGENNSKAGNRYLAWAWVEAANFAQRYDDQARAYYQRKKAQTNSVVATKALACKLAKAAWHMMTKNQAYNAEKVFGPGPGGSQKAEAEPSNKRKEKAAPSPSAKGGESSKKRKEQKALKK